MKIEIVTKNFTLNDNLKQIVEKKLSKLDKFLQDDVVVKLILQEVNKEKCMMELKVIIDKNRVLRATAIGPNMYDNIDIVIPKIEGQIRKLRTYNDKKLRTKEIDKLIKASSDEVMVIKRVKTVELNKISVDDAIKEMQLAERDFYVFVNQETNMINVLYERLDGEVGLLDLVY